MPAVRRPFLACALLAVAAAAGAQTFTATVTSGDGVGLATDVYWPIGHGFGPWPTVLVRTPYGRDGQKAWCQGFNLLGFACVAQDERGTGGSGGRYSGYLEEGPDGRATLEWLGRQAWCDGKVGTFGASALGMTQYSMAPAAPALLKAQVPIVATPDFYHHAVYQGGALRYGLDHKWLSQQNALDVFEQLKAHRLWGPFWESFAVLPQVAAIDVPALHTGGWYDIFLQGTLDAFAATQHHGGPHAVGRQKLIIGPWTHYNAGQASAGALTYPPNAIMVDDFPTIWRDWFEHHLKGERPGVADWPAVRVYLMGAVGETGAPGNTWVTLDDWPPATGTVAAYLTSSLALDTTVPASGSRTLVSNPLDPVPTRGGQELLADYQDDGTPGAGPHDQRPIEGRGDVLVFTSAPLAEPLVVMGRLTVRIWLTPDTPDLDIAVRLTDVYLDGRSMLITDGIQRARKRCGDDIECFLTPGQPVELTVDLWSTAYVFAAGHKVRIDVSGSNYPRFEVNPNDGRDLNLGGPGVTARPRLLFGPATPSRLELPVVGAPRPPRRALSRP